LLAQWLDQDKTLGGPGKIVEIDEAKIGKRKYNRGRIVRGQWVFGCYERDSGRIFVIPVKDRTESTLIKEIRDHILPGTIIHSDGWRGYTSISQHNYIHACVNHSQNFVDPVTGCHTQNIERVWRDMRGAIPRYGISQKHYKFYLAEFLFKRIYAFDERIEAFFQIMKDMYPLSNNIVE
jgi:transposase-like protein